MNLIELLFFLFAVFLSFAFGRCFFKYIGWWGALPAPILGFGIVIGIIATLNKLLPKRLPLRPQQKLNDTRKED